MDIKEKIFRETYLFTREDVVKSLELFIEHEKLNEKRYLSGVLKNRIKLCEKLLAAVKKSKLPVLTDLWWFYEYQIFGDRIELHLCNADEIEVEDGIISQMTEAVEYTLIKVECDYLTVEQYASMLGVRPVTVRQWIRRGKLRHAKKVGGDWLIPDIEDKPRRYFDCVNYVVEDGAKIESEEFPLLSLCDTIFISQNRETKNKFNCYLDNYKTKFRSELELNRSEIERLEYTIIESGKASAENLVQYIPYIRDDTED